MRHLLLHIFIVPTYIAVFSSDPGEFSDMYCHLWIIRIFLNIFLFSSFLGLSGIGCRMSSSFSFLAFLWKPMHMAKFKTYTEFVCCIWHLLRIDLIQKDSGIEISSLDVTAEHLDNTPDLKIITKI